MLPTTVRALALGCVGVALSGCITDPATKAAISAGVANPGGITAGQVTGALISASPGLQTKVSDLFGQIKVAGGVACGKAPDLASAARILAAKFGNATNVADVVLVQTVVGLACTAFGTPTAFSAGTAPEKPVKKVEPKAGPQTGAAVKGSVVILDQDGNPIAIPVTGTVVDPSKVK